MENYTFEDMYVDLRNGYQIYYILLLNNAYYNNLYD